MSANVILRAVSPRRRRCQSWLQDGLELRRQLGVEAHSLRRACCQSRAGAGEACHRRRPPTAWTASWQGPRAGSGCLVPRNEVTDRSQAEGVRHSEHDCRRPGSHPSPPRPTLFMRTPPTQASRISDAGIMTRPALGSLRERRGDSSFAPGWSKQWGAMLLGSAAGQTSREVRPRWRQ